jgi:hypothetical protein
VTFFISALNLVMALLFLEAALLKARDLPGFISALQQLRFPLSAAKNIALAVVFLEVAASSSLIFSPASLLSAGIVVVLSTAFAAAALIALSQGQEVVYCHCFGAAANARLGPAQLWALPLWWGAALLSWSQSQDVPFTAAAIEFATVSLILAAVAVLQAFGPWRQARGDRLSAREMYLWLRS